MVRGAKILAWLGVAWCVLSLGVGGWILPGLLLHPPLPTRTEAARAAVRQQLGGTWERVPVLGGQGVPLEGWRCRRPGSRGVAVILHGFGDDAWGSAPRLQDLPDLDGFVFTFRNRDHRPEVPCTLGGWETQDVVAVVQCLEQSGLRRDRIVLVGASQGAGVALLALERLEAEGPPLAGALLESPWQDLRAAGRDHLRGTLGRGTFLAEGALRVGLWMAERRVGHPLSHLSPERASRGLRTPVALLTGDQDPVTPVSGVQAIARHHPDLTLVSGAGHLEASQRLPGGWQAWAKPRLDRWFSPKATDAR